MIQEKINQARHLAKEIATALKLYLVGDRPTKQSFRVNEEAKLEAAIYYVKELIAFNCTQEDGSLSYLGHLVYLEAFDFLLQEGVITKSTVEDSLGNSTYHWVVDK